MLGLQALVLQPIGLDSWIGVTLLLGMMTLICLSFFVSGETPSVFGDHSTEAKSKAYLAKHRNNQTGLNSNYNVPASPGINAGSGWTIDKTMRVMTSIVVLLAAIYIIIFDQEANADRQKWAFGAVGLVFGHWARR